MKKLIAPFAVLAAVLMSLFIVSPAQAWDGGEGKCEDVWKAPSSSQICVNDEWTNTTSGHVNIDEIRVSSSNASLTNSVRVDVILKNKLGVVKWERNNVLLDGLADGKRRKTWYPNVDVTKDSTITVNYNVDWVIGGNTSGQIVLNQVGCAASC